MSDKLLLSGNEAIALGAFDAGAQLGVGYPGTPSSEILDNLAGHGVYSEWAPNEKVALEVGIGGAFGGARAIVTMKHVGLNVAADPLFTIAYSGTPGGVVIVSADDPGMASSRNEQDNRRYAAAAGVPMLEPSDSQEAYELTRLAFDLAEKYRTPVLLRVTTRICHSKCVVKRAPMLTAKPCSYTKDVKANVMIPAYAKIAHRNLRAKLHNLETEAAAMAQEIPGANNALGIIANGISACHVRDAAPEAGLLKMPLTYPLPLERIREFAAKYDRVFVVEEGDPIMFEACRAAGIMVEGKAEMYRFGELNVSRIRRMLAGDLTPEAPPTPGKPPQLCVGCPHRQSFEILRDNKCIVAGDIGCYTLGVLPPFEALDTCVCMGASITTGAGMRHVLPEADARRVVSIIGDSTFWHTGINGIVELVYNRPKTGHVVLILDNSTTAMTGLQENPGTGRNLSHAPAPQLNLERTLLALGMDEVIVCDPVTERAKLEESIKSALASDKLTCIIARRPCILAAVKIRKYQEEGKN